MLVSLILPIIGQIFSIYMVYSVLGASILGIIAVCALLSVLDALFTDKTNMMSSRNAGFIYYLTYVGDNSGNVTNKSDDNRNNT